MANSSFKLQHSLASFSVFTIPVSVGNEQNPLSVYYCYDFEGSALRRTWVETGLLSAHSYDYHFSRERGNPNMRMAFACIISMHEMWKEYVIHLLKNIGKNQVAAVLFGANLHCAIFRVVECKVDSFIGVLGIMIRETAETFGIITKDNKFRGHRGRPRGGYGREDYGHRRSPRRSPYRGGRGYSPRRSPYAERSRRYRSRSYSPYGSPDRGYGRRSGYVR